MRSTRPDVRNPLLQLETARRLGEWLEPATCQVLARFLTELAEDARRRAGECWKKHKAPMALYWKVVAVYARHLAQICRHIQRAGEASGYQSREARLETALRELLEIGGHVAINTVGDVRLQGKLIKAREQAALVLRSA